MLLRLAINTQRQFQKLAQHRVLIHYLYIYIHMYTCVTQSNYTKKNIILHKEGELKTRYIRHNQSPE